MGSMFTGQNRPSSNSWFRSFFLSAPVGKVSHSHPCRTTFLSVTRRSTAHFRNSMREKRPAHIIKRASKELASSSWSGGDYKPKFEDVPSLTNFLQTNSIRYVVFDASLSRTARKDYHDLLARTLESFTLEKSFAIERAGRKMDDAIRVYRATESPP